MNNQRLYTQEEVREVAAKAHCHGYSLCLGTSDKLEFDEWFEKTLKEIHDDDLSVK